MITLTFRLKGGTGSGNYGHSGRPGKIGGSMGDGSSGGANGGEPPWPSHVKGKAVQIGDTWHNVELLKNNTIIRVTTYGGFASDSSPLTNIGGASVRSAPQQPARHHYTYETIQKHNKASWDYWQKYA